MLGLGNSISTSTYVSSEGEALLLDTYGGSAAAYSLRKLSSSYSGEVLQVRRAFDHVEVDVGFDADGLLSLDSPVTNVVEESTGVTQGSSTSATKFGEFCGDASYAKVDSMTEASHVEIVTWYDQSGNGRDATQAAAVNQPRIYDRTTGMVTENGKPALTQGASYMALQINLNLTQPNSIFCVVDLQGTSYKTITRGTSSLWQWYGQNNSASYGMYAGSWLTATPASGQVLDSLLYDGSNSVMFQNGSSFVTGNAGSNNMSNNGIGQGNITGNFEGKLQELIFYNTDQFATPTRTSIESNINTFYSIY